MEIMIMGKDEYDPVELAETMQLDGLGYEGFFPPLFAEKDLIDGKYFLKEGLIQKRDDLKLAQFPDLKDPAFFDDAKRFMEKYHKTDYALYIRTRIGVSGVLNSMGVDGFSYAVYDDPYVATTLMDMYNEWVIELLSKAQEMGFDFVWFFDDVAYSTGPMCSPDTFREIFMPGLRKVAKQVELPWVYHSDGNLMPILDDLLTLGMNAIHPLEPGPMDIEAVKEKYGNKVCLIGNIDLHYTLTRGTPEEVDAEVKRRMEIIGKDGGYIISSANTITDYCKLENVFAMRDAIVKYRSK
jgi:uroporphyrinogen decarboxylase